MERDYTVQELAGNRNLWEEYIDPGNNAPFDSMTQDEREAAIRDIWPETPEERKDELIANAVGKHLSASRDMDWLGYWPEVDDDLMVIGIAEENEIPEEATLLWEDGTETDGSQGFDAFRC